MSPCYRPESCCHGEGCSKKSESEAVCAFASLFSLVSSLAKMYWKIPNGQHRSKEENFNARELINCSSDAKDANVSKSLRHLSQCSCFIKLSYTSFSLRNILHRMIEGHNGLAWLSPSANQANFFIHYITITARGKRNSVHGHGEYGALWFKVDNNIWLSVLTLLLLLQANAGPNTNGQCIHNAGICSCCNNTTSHLYSI